MPDTHLDGYLATPQNGSGSGVLVLHAWWGLNEHVRAFCRQLAGSGYVAFAPDLYHGEVTDSIPEAESLAGALFENLQEARADLNSAMLFLNELAKGHRGLAVIGFSLGAFFALDLSVSAPDQVRSVVVFYGTRPGDYSSSQAVYLGHFAETDGFESQSDVDSLELSLRQAGRPVSFYRYPGTGHWFFEPDRPQAFKKAAADLAWKRTLAFLMDTNSGDPN